MNQCKIQMQQRQKQMKTNEDKKMNIDLRHLISECEYLGIENKSKRIYCMTKKELEEKQQQNLIIEKDNKMYYRWFKDEYWLVHVIKPKKGSKSI